MPLSKTTLDLAATKWKQKQTNKDNPRNPPWMDVDSARPLDKRKAFKCATCGSYVMPVADGRLRVHFWHTVGRDKKRLAEFRCPDNHVYHTEDTYQTPYAERTATVQKCTETPLHFTYDSP